MKRKLKQQQNNLVRKEEELPATSSVSAVTIAKVLSGIDFPKRKNSLREYVKKNVSKVYVEDPDTILDVINRLANKEYSDMAEVEKAVGNII